MSPRPEVMPISGEILARSALLHAVATLSHRGLRYWLASLLRLIFTNHFSGNRSEYSVPFFLLQVSVQVLSLSIMSISNVVCNTDHAISFARSISKRFLWAIHGCVDQPVTSLQPVLGGCPAICLRSPQKGECVHRARRIPQSCTVSTENVLEPG